MKFFSVRSVFFLLISSLVCVIPPELLASKENDEREVYLASVQGDVRVSLGKDHRPDLNQTWEQALAGEPIQQGYAVATGDGRAEIEFENGSIVYLAEDSLLLFRELSAPGDRIVSSLSLATGTATFFLQSTSGASYFIETPTDRLSIIDPESFFARVDVFLDATAITPQGNQGETLHRRSFQDRRIARGQTLLLRGGEVVQLAGRSEGTSEGLEVSPMDSWELVFAGLPDFPLPSRTPQPNQENQMKSSPADTQHSSASELDAWVCERQAHRNAVTAAALKASGLSAPIPGLADLYEHGTFFSCDPYGTCWEAKEPGEAQDSASQSAVPDLQPTHSMQTQSGGTFQPQTIRWQEWWQGWCSPPTLQTVTRVAHTPEELQRLLRKREAAQKAGLLRPSYARSCENGYWIPYRRHFARVVTPQLPRHCAGAKCKPIHAPRPVWVRAGKRIGFVPAHPKDVKGKPPINLREGIVIPPFRPGERTERVALEPSQKVSVLDKAPREFRGKSLDQALHVPAPEIHTHLVQEAARESSLSLSAHATSPITYDYKSHHFLMPASTFAGEKSKEVPVGGIDSHGKIDSFADGRHSSFAQAFGSGSGHGGYSSGYSGGGHGSGYSSGSYSSGSPSSGMGSYSGGSSHSSGGGGGSSGSSSGSSSGGSSSSSSSSSGGGSRGKP